jgi:hypothetical protein
MSVLIDLNKDEAIVLFELLFKICNQKFKDFPTDNSEQNVLLTIEAQLEKQLAEPFS